MSVEDSTAKFDADLSVSDRQYSKRRRHKSINDARDRVPETLLDIEQRLLEGGMTGREADRAALRTVETLGMELFWMLESHPEGDEFLFNRHLGNARLPEPAVDGEVVDGGFMGDLSFLETSFPYVSYRGLKSVLRGPDEIRGRWVVKTGGARDIGATETVTTSLVTPRKVTTEAYLACVEFLGKADFGIDFDEDRPLCLVKPDPGAEAGHGVKQFDASDLYEQNERLTESSNNDQLIVISAGSRTPVSGTGKTTLALTLAKALDTSRSGFSSLDQATFSLRDLAYNKLGAVEAGSALIYDEAQGTSSGTGLNSRRGMKTETLDAINGILNRRNKNLTVIIVFQQMRMADTNLHGLIDAWVLIRKGIEERMGPTATHYDVVSNDFEWGRQDPNTPAKEDLTWDALPSTDQDYARMEWMKERADRKSAADDEEVEEAQGLADLPKPQRDELIKFAYDAETQDDIADGMEVTRQRVSQILNGDS